MVAGFALRRLIRGIILPTGSWPLSNPIASSRSFLPITLLILVGVAIRFRLYLSNGSYWYDEAYCLLNVFNHTFLDLIGRTEHHLVSPPAQLLVSRIAYLLFGAAEWAMRLPALVAGLAALPLLALTGRQVDRRWAWLPVAWMALSRNFLIHSCEARGYTIDALSAILITFATIRVIGSGRWSWPATALVALAALAPWFSFPSAFILGGACAAVLARAASGGGRWCWGLAAAIAATTLISGASLWLLHARHISSPGLVEHWGPKGWGGFPDWSRTLQVVFWPLNRGVEVGNYGTRGMGIPLLFLAGLGLFRLTRQNRPLAVLLVVPGLLAVIASYLEKYPLADRTVMFLLPGLWVAAAVGFTELASRIPSRRAIAFLLVVLLAQDVVGVGQSLIHPPDPPPARQAFEIVRANRQPGDVVWVSHAEVYYTYYGREENVFGCLTWPADVAHAAGGRPVWLVDQPAGEVSVATPLVDLLKSQGYVEVERRTLSGVVLMRYAVPTRER